MPETPTAVTDRTPPAVGPRISVVVPTLNQGRFLAQCLSSIVGQGYPDLELIVLDGGSTDSTLEVIERFAGAIHYWRSAPDGGQAQAINEGFGRATGDIVAWLNSDDMYLPEALSRAAAALQDRSQGELVYGACIRLSEEGGFSWLGHADPFDARRLSYDAYIAQPSCFWTRRLWERTGPLDEALHYAFDWEWLIRASRLTAFRPIHEALSLYRLHSTQKTGTGGDRRAREVLQVVEANAPPDMARAYRDVYAALPRLRRIGRFVKQLRLVQLDRLILPRICWRLVLPAIAWRHGGGRIQTALSAF
jgi:glycosyltransferase involved in cell wall biosynthesis